MLVALTIRDIVLIDRLGSRTRLGLECPDRRDGRWQIHPARFVFTAIGARGDGSLVRTGTEQGQVTAVFNLPRKHPAGARR